VRIGLQAILSGARAILLGEAEVVLAARTNRCPTPVLLPRARLGVPARARRDRGRMYRDGFDDPLSGMVMARTAEELAVEAGSRAPRPTSTPPRTQRRCEAARRSGRFAAEIGSGSGPAARRGASSTATSIRATASTPPACTKLAPSSGPAAR